MGIESMGTFLEHGEGNGMVKSSIVGLRLLRFAALYIQACCYLYVLIVLQLSSTQCATHVRNDIH